MSPTIFKGAVNSSNMGCAKKTSFIFRNNAMTSFWGTQAACLPLNPPNPIGPDRRGCTGPFW